MRFSALYLMLIAAAVLLQSAAAAPRSELLNASFDATRSLFDQINPLFAEKWRREKGREILIRQSHGGSGKQARSVLYGLPADVVSLGLAFDVEVLARKGLLASDWQGRLPNRSSPFVSTIVFLVRHGNPKKIHDWSDVWRDDVIPLSPSPKTSGGARWNYLAAWGAALRLEGGDTQKARECVSKIFRRAPVLDTGARAATMNFAYRGLGDVLLTWESEAYQALEAFGSDKLEVVVPSISILAEPKVALVDSVVDAKGTRVEAQAYLDFLYSDAAQRVAAKEHFRIDPQIAHSPDILSGFLPIELFTVEELFGSWDQAQEQHFSAGGIFDQIFE